MSIRVIVGVPEGDVELKSGEVACEVVHSHLPVIMLPQCWQPS